jgi:hypothetical protein
MPGLETPGVVKLEPRTILLLAALQQVSGPQWEMFTPEVMHMASVVRPITLQQVFPQGEARRQQGMPIQVNRKVQSGDR